MDSSLWVFLPILLLIAIIVAAGYRLRKGVKNEAPGPQGQRPYGVHGWLAVYISASYYLAPLYAIGSLSNELSRAEAANPTLATLAGWGNYKAGAWMLVLGAIAVQWRSAWLLNNRWLPSSVRFAKIVTLAMPPVVIVGDTILGAVLLNVTDGESFVKGIAAGLFRGLIWAAYFHFSKRVRNTYYPVKASEFAPRNDLAGYMAPPAGTPPAFPAPSATSTAMAGNPLDGPRDQAEPIGISSPQIAIGDYPPPSQVDVVPTRTCTLKVDNDALWAAALAELEEGRRHAGTWARSFSAADGDDAKAKAAYLRERVHQMHEEAVTASQASEAVERAVSMETETRLATATKRFVEGSPVTPDEIVTLVIASDKDASLTRLTDRLRGNTLLHLCARHGLHDEALRLIRNGSNPDAGNGNGKKPFEMADANTQLASALRTA